MGYITYLGAQLRKIVSATMGRPPWVGIQGEIYPLSSLELHFQVPGLVNIQKAMENGPVEIVSFPINSMVIFHCELLVHQRVSIEWSGML